jgi:hypothetical protein
MSNNRDLSDNENVS